MLTFPGAFVVSHRTTFRHDTLHLSDFGKEFLFSLSVPDELVKVVLAVAQQSIGWRAASGLFHQACISKGLESVRIVRTLGHLSGFLLNRNEF